MSDLPAIKKHLSHLLVNIIEEIDEPIIGIAFSGGIDSSLLTKVCIDSNKSVTLLTVGFSSQRDVQLSSQLSKIFDVPFLSHLITLDELERGLTHVLQVIDYRRIARLEISIGFYFVFQLAANHGIQTVLSAHGTDELFCGYHAYREVCDDELALQNLMQNFIEIGKCDKQEIDKLASEFGISYFCPFLSDRFIESALAVPIRFKIRHNNDHLRKHILRSLAIDLGVPEFAAKQSRKAFQYSSGLHKALRRLAKKRGYTKTVAKNNGFRSEMEAYISSLQTK